MLAVVLRRVACLISLGCCDYMCCSDWRLVVVIICSVASGLCSRLCVCVLLMASVLVVLTCVALPDVCWLL